MDTHIHGNSHVSALNSTSARDGRDRGGDRGDRGERDRGGDRGDRGGRDRDRDRPETRKPWDRGKMGVS